MAHFQCSSPLSDIFQPPSSFYSSCEHSNNFSCSPYSFALTISSRHKRLGSNKSVLSHYLIISSYPDSPAEISTIDMLLIGDLLRYQNCVCGQLKIKYCQFIVEFAVSLYLCGKQGVTEVMMLLCISNGCLEF